MADKFERTSMTLCEHVAQNETLDYDNDELKDISKAVDILVNRFVAAWQEKRTDLLVTKLRLCGSMAEKTRIKVPRNEEDHFEFDYLAELETSPGSGAMWAVHAGACTGYVFIERDVVDADSVKGTTDFLSNSFSNVFLVDFFDAIQNMCHKNLCCRMKPGEDIGSPDEGRHFWHGCKFCTIHMRTGNLILNSRAILRTTAIGKLSFDWSTTKVHDKVYQYIGNDDNKKGPISLFGKKTSIHVDFHPVFVVNYDSRKGLVYSLFPKPCTRHIGNDCNSLTWRLSTQEIEIKLIQEASQEHKLAFMTMKYIMSSPYYSSKESSVKLNIFGDVKQYFVKNIFLLHLLGCTQKAAVTTDCLCEMFGELSKCYLENNLPQFHLKYNLLDIIRIDQHKRQIHVPVLGHKLNTVKELLILQRGDDDLSDLQRDLPTIQAIVRFWERKFPFERHDKDLIENVVSDLKDFLQFRREHSSFETTKHVVELHRSLPNGTLKDEEEDMIMTFLSMDLV